MGVKIIINTSITTLAHSCNSPSYRTHWAEQQSCLYSFHLKSAV